MFSINLNAICFDFARQSHIERFTPTIYAEALYISNLYTMTIDIPRSGRRRARDVAPPMSPEGAPSRNRPVADNSAADMPSSRSSSSTTLTATARLSGRAGVWTGAAVGRIGRKVLALTAASGPVCTGKYGWTQGHYGSIGPAWICCPQGQNAVFNPNTQLYACQ